MEQAKSSRLHAYVVLSLMIGIRTEEARALQWDHVVAWVDDEPAWRPVAEVGFDHDRFAVYVWRSVRAHGDTKTRGPAARWNSWTKRSTPFASVTRARRLSASRPTKRGKAPASSSAPGPERRSIPLTCGGDSG
nr:hypothetical protein GCM10010200_001890 [Actinomadura rugatobispora]